MKVTKKSLNARVTALEQIVAEFMAEAADCAEDVLKKTVRCKAKTVKGKQCKNVTDYANGYCGNHQHLVRQSSGKGLMDMQTASLRVRR